MSIQSYQDTLGKAGKLPQQITDATQSISEGAKKVHDMTTKIDAALKQIPTYNPVSGAVIGGLSKAAGALDNAAAKAERAAQAIDKAGNKIATTISPISKAAQSVRQSLTDLQNCKAVLNASSLVVDAAVNSVTGHFHPRANEKAFANFDTTWDSWAKMVNTTYGKLYPAGQKNILETLARANFGDNVYALGSAIKNESAGIFGGIADFEDAIHAFRGSYRNPIEAAKKIEAGVKGIINATERVANSINGMVKAYQSKGGKIMGEMPGNPILSYIGNLHNTKAISAINKTLTIGGGAATLWTDGVGIKNAVGSGDIKKIYSAGKKTVDDAKAIVKGLKNNNNATRSTTPSTSQAAQKQSSNSESQKQANNNQQNGQQNNSQDNNQQVGGVDSYVCSGATMRCSMGTNLAKLTVLPTRTVFLTGQPMANISDHLSMVNLAPFGRCRSLGFPATASATAANHGSLTPMPCMHNTPFPWMSGKNDYIVKGDPALLKSSTCSCMWGGTISIVNDGQNFTGIIDMDKVPVESKGHFIKKALIEKYKDYISMDLNKEDLAKAILQKNEVSEYEKEKLWRDLKKARRNYAEDFYLKNSKGKDNKKLIKLIASKINGIDFNYPVEESKLPPPNKVCRYEAFVSEKPSFDFVFEKNDNETVPTPEEVAICDPVVVIDKNDGVKKVIYKGLAEYSISGSPCPCLKSTAKNIRAPRDDNWGNRKPDNMKRTQGGAKQIDCMDLTKTSGILISRKSLKERTCYNV